MEYSYTMPVVVVESPIMTSGTSFHLERGKCLGADQSMLRRGGSAAMQYVYPGTRLEGVGGKECTSHCLS